MNLQSAYYMPGTFIPALEILYFKWNIKFPSLLELMFKGGRGKNPHKMTY